MKLLVFRGIGGVPHFQLFRCHPLHISPGRFVITPLDRVPVKIGIQIDEQNKIKMHMSIDFQLLEAGRWRIVVPLIEQRIRFGNINIIVECQVASRRHPVTVRSLMLHHQHKRLVSVTTCLKPLNCQVCNNIGTVPVNPFTTFGRNHVRVVIESLARQDLPIIKTLRPSLEVRFSIEGSRVAGLLEQLRKNLLVPVERITIVHKTIFVAMLA